MQPFTLTLNPQDRRPLYEQLYRYLREEILTGSLPAGEKLPSKRSLASFLSVSIHTVEGAYDQLAAEGYITAKPKRGYFVCRLEQVALLPRQEESTIETRNTKPAFAYDLRTAGVSSGCFPFSVWGKLSREALYHEELLQPGHPQGDLALRESIRGYLHAFRGVDCNAGQIVVGAGTEYLLSLIVQILGSYRVYAMENPSYPKACRILKNCGVHVKLLELDDCGVSMEAVRRSHATVLHITPSHQFPTGVVMPIGRRTQLLGWAKAAEQRYLIEDDYDSEFRFAGRPIPALQGLGGAEKVIYLGTFSRSISPTVRIGYLILPEKLCSVFHEKCGSYACTVSRFEQYTLRRFLENGHFERHLNRSRNRYRKRCESLVRALRQADSHGRLRFLGENIGLHILLNVQNGMTEEELVRTAGEHGVGVMGISIYYISQSPSMPESTVVLDCGNLEEAELEEAVKRLKRAWNL